jgi:hypothetical protein
MRIAAPDDVSYQLSLKIVVLFLRGTGHEAGKAPVFQDMAKIDPTGCIERRGTRFFWSTSDLNSVNHIISLIASPQARGGAPEGPIPVFCLYLRDHPPILHASKIASDLCLRAFSARQISFNVDIPSRSNVSPASPTIERKSL